MTTIVNGLVGGAVVAVLATLAVQLARRDQAATVVELLTGTEGAAPRWWSALSGVAYGTAAGGVLVAVDLLVLDVLAVPPTWGEAFAVAVPGSVVLLAVWLGVGRIVLGDRLARPQVTELAVYHLVFAVGLGVWIRLTWIT